jgi:hypothetical protein
MKTPSHSLIAVLLPLTFFSSRSIALAADISVEDKDLRPLPAGALRVLAEAPSYRDYRELGCHLQGTAIDLDGDGKAGDWFVTTSNGCGWGAAAGPLWLLKQPGESHVVVLASGGYDVTFGTAKENGLRSISVGMGTASHQKATRMTFDGKQYVVSKSTTVDMTGADKVAKPANGDTAPAQGNRQAPPAKLHPILLDPGRALGVVADRRWLDLDKMPKTYKGKPVPTNDCESKKRRIELGGIKGGETYRLFTSHAPVGTGTGSRFSYMCTATASEHYTIDIKPASKEGKAWRYAIGGDWNVLPRLAKKQKDGWVVDVDGDGTDEVVKVTTKSSKNDDGEPIKLVTYTLVMKGKKQRLARTEIGGVYGKDSMELETADLNGDGILDFIITETGFDPSVMVVDVASGKPKTVAGYSDNSD